MNTNVVIDLTDSFIQKVIKAGIDPTDPVIQAAIKQRWMSRVTGHIAVAAIGCAVGARLGVKLVEFLALYAARTLKA